MFIKISQGESPYNTQMQPLCGQQMQETLHPRIEEEDMVQLQRNPEIKLQKPQVLRELLCCSFDWWKSLQSIGEKISAEIVVRLQKTFLSDYPVSEQLSTVSLPQNFLTFLQMLPIPRESTTSTYLCSVIINLPHNYVTQQLLINYILVFSYFSNPRSLYHPNSLYNERSEG